MFEGERISDVRQYMVDVSRQLQSIGLGRFDQAITDGVSFGSLAKHPRTTSLLFTGEQGNDILSTGVNDLKIATLTFAIHDAHGC